MLVIFFWKASFLFLFQLTKMFLYSSSCYFVCFVNESNLGESRQFGCSLICGCSRSFEVADELVDRCGRTFTLSGDPHRAHFCSFPSGTASCWRFWTSVLVCKQHNRTGVTVTSVWTPAPQCVCSHSRSKVSSCVTFSAPLSRSSVTEAE